MTRWASLIHANMLSSDVFIKVRYHQQAMQDLKKLIMQDVTNKNIRPYNSILAIRFEDIHHFKNTQ